MERRKSRASLDPSAVVKAAAWAWYQRGSGSEGKSISDFDATRARHAPIPSRYKLEAMKMAEEGPEKKLEAMRMAEEGPEKKLEAMKMAEEGPEKKLEAMRMAEEGPEKKLEAMKMAEEGPEKELSSSTASSPTSPSNLSHNSLFDTYEIDRISQQLDYLIERSSKGIIAGNNNNESRKKKKKKKVIIKGFWGRHAIVCGTRDDVLETVMVPAAAGNRKSKW